MEAEKIRDIQNVIEDSLTEYTDLGIELSFKSSEYSKVCFITRLIFSDVLFKRLSYQEFNEMIDKIVLSANRFSTEYGYVCKVDDQNIFELYDEVIELYVLESKIRCSGTTKVGNRCSKLSNEKYCYLHRK